MVRKQTPKNVLMVLLFKLLLLALIAPFIVLSSFMFVAPFLKLGFSWPPFLMASAAWIACSALIAYRRRDWGPVATDHNGKQPRVAQHLALPLL